MHGGVLLVCSFFLVELLLSTGSSWAWDFAVFEDGILDVRLFGRCCFWLNIFMGSVGICNATGALDIRSLSW